MRRGRAIGVERRRPLPLPAQHVADAGVAQRDVALPTRVVRIGGRDLLADRQRRAIGAERIVDLPGRRMRIADQVVAQRQLASPLGLRGLVVDDRRELAARLLGHLPLPRDIAELAVLVAEHQQQHRMLATQAAGHRRLAPRQPRRLCRPAIEAVEGRLGLAQQLLDQRARYALLIGDPHRAAELVGRDPDRIRQQAFGVLAIAPGQPAAGSRQHRQQQHGGADALPDAGTPAGRDQLALAQVVERHAEHARDQLQLGVLFAVGLGAEVGGDRLGRLVGQAAGGIDLEAQGWREAFVAPEQLWREARRPRSAAGCDRPGPAA